MEMEVNGTYLKDERHQQIKEFGNWMKKSEFQEEKAHTPSCRSGHACARLPSDFVRPSEQAIVIFGGANESNFFNDVWIWKIVKEEETYQSSWRQCQLAPDAATSELGMGRSQHSLHYVNSTRELNHLWLNFVVLGNILMNAPSGEEMLSIFPKTELRVEVLSLCLASNQYQWKSITNSSSWMPKARQSHASIIVATSSSRHLFLFGGQSAADDFFNDLCVYDCKTQEWKLLQPSGVAPPPRACAALAHSNQQLFLYGGYDGTQQFGDHGNMFVYDIQRNQWSQIDTTGPKPSPRINHSFVHIHSNQLILFGGRHKKSKKNDLFVFDTEAASWRHPKIQGPHPRGRNAHMGVCCMFPGQRTGYFVCFGGYAGSRTWLGDTHVLKVPDTREHAEQEHFEGSSDQQEILIKSSPDDFQPQLTPVAPTSLKRQRIAETPNQVLSVMQTRKSGLASRTISPLLCRFSASSQHSQAHAEAPSGTENNAMMGLIAENRALKQMVTRLEGELNRVQNNGVSSENSLQRSLESAIEHFKQYQDDTRDIQQQQVENLQHQNESQAARIVKQDRKIEELEAQVASLQGKISTVENAKAQQLEELEDWIQKWRRNS